MRASLVALSPKTFPKTSPKPPHPLQFQVCCLPSPPGIGLLPARRAPMPALAIAAPPRGSDSSSEGTMDRLLSLLLVELDGVQESSGPPVLLLGVCTSPSQLDPAILRPGRLDVHVPVRPPASAERREILRAMLAATPVDWDQVSLEELAAATEGFSLAQLSSLCREAAMCALREELACSVVQSRHFVTARRVALRA